MSEKEIRYRCKATGNVLERQKDMFHWRGRSFHGLVDVAANGLYDDPQDSFADHVGLASSLSQGLIEPLEPATILTYADMKWLMENGGALDRRQRGDTPERLKRISVPPDLLLTEETRQNWWNWFNAAVVQLFKARRPSIEYVAAFINNTLDSSDLGGTSWMAIGPGCAYTDVHALPGQRLGETPSRFRYFEFAVDIRDWPRPG